MKRRIKLILVGMLLLMIVGCGNKENDNLLLVKGKWIADGTQYKTVISVVDGKTTYAEGDDELPPYILAFDGLGNYSLQLKNNTEAGTYIVNKDLDVILTPNDNDFWVCQLKTNEELYCLKHAHLFAKE